jgi:hypothetical protein
MVIFNASEPLSHLNNFTVMLVCFCLETVYYVFYLIRFVVNLLNLEVVQIKLIGGVGGGLTKQIEAFSGGWHLFPST